MTTSPLSPADAVAYVDVPDADHARAPGVHLWARENLTGLELAHAAVSRRFLASLPDGDGHPVLVLPGFLAGASSTSFLRKFLRTKGYRVYDWGQGRNLGVREGLRGRLSARLDHITDRTGASISVIGWSAGGIYAREIARENPDRIRSVITMGTPMRGNLRATAAWPAYSLLNRGRHAVDLDAALIAARAQPLSVPTTCIYSRYDGIVAWELATSLLNETTENVEVSATHLGYGHHRGTLAVVADRLAQPEGAWRPYDADRKR